MPSNYTPNYQLNQWAHTDQVLMADFNADNAKIDGAIRAVDAKADRKADVSALEALAQRVNTQETALTGQASIIAKLGNCVIDISSYRGGGSGDHSLTFPHKPILVFVVGDYTCTMMAYGNSKASMLSGGTSSAEASLSWGGNTLSWKDPGGCNARGLTYQVVALLDATK